MAWDGILKRSEASWLEMSSMKTQLGWEPRNFKPGKTLTPLQLTFTKNQHYKHWQARPCVVLHMPQSLGGRQKEKTAVINTTLEGQSYRKNVSLVCRWSSEWHSWRAHSRGNWEMGWFSLGQKKGKSCVGARQFLVLPSGSVISSYIILDQTSHTLYVSSPSIKEHPLLELF